MTKRQEIQNKRDATRLNLCPFTAVQTPALRLARLGACRSNAFGQVLGSRVRLHASFRVLYGGPSTCLPATLVFTLLPAEYRCPSFITNYRVRC